MEYLLHRKYFIFECSFISPTRVHATFTFPAAKVFHIWTHVLQPNTCTLLLMENYSMWSALWLANYTTLPSRRHPGNGWSIDRYCPIGDAHKWGCFNDPHRATEPRLDYETHHNDQTPGVWVQFAQWRHDERDGVSNNRHVCSIVGSGAYQSKHQSSASMAFPKASNMENVSIW